MDVSLGQDLRKYLDLLSENWNSQNNKEDRCKGNGGIPALFKNKYGK